MARSAIANRLIAEEFLTPSATTEILPVSERVAYGEIQRRIKPAFEFSKAVLLEKNHIQTGSRIIDVAIAVLLHVVLLGVPILTGLYFTDTINIKEYASMILVAPPPPPPPPPPAASIVVKAAAVRHTFVNEGKLLAPTVIPKQIADIKEVPLEPDSFGAMAGGVPGGVPGGQMGGVIGGVIGGLPNTAAGPVAPPVGRTAPIPVGGRVRRPKAIVHVRPDYPTLAQQSRIQGNVQIDAVLNEQGNVIEMKIVSGPPLLYQAALDAVKKWKYEPSYLNETPIAVELIITITFSLNQ